MSAEQPFDEAVYAGEVDSEVEDEDYDNEEEYDENDDRVDEVSEGDHEEIGAEADDEDEEGAAAGPNGAAGAPGGGAQGQMLFLPGLGYIPLSSLANIPGLSIGGRGGPAGPGAAPQQAAAPTPEGERPWRGLAEMPRVTQETVADLAGALRQDGKQELTVLLLGKGGVGKSSTANSLLNERCANTLPWQQDTARPIAFSRKAPDGFVLTVIDTPSMLDQDAVSDARLEAIGRAVNDRDVDVVLFLDRLDAYAVDALDVSVVDGITRVLGAGIWANAVLCFTRASEGAAPPGVEFEHFVETRSRQLKEAIQRAGAPAADIPVALVENSSRCPVNTDGEKVVPGDVPWVADLLEKAVDVALNTPPFECRPAAAAKAADPNRRRKWLVPLVLAAQVAAKLLLDRIMDDDGCRGDANGPFDPITVRERREELRAEREKAARRRRRLREAKGPVTAAAADVGAFDEDDEDYME